MPMKLKTNIALIGGRGAGKSKISRKFGKLSGRVVMSTDTLISYEAGGITIARIVEENGWRDFRNKEYQILEKLNALNNIIIDCGGGIMVEAPDESVGETIETYSERKIEILKSNATVVYVKRSMKWLIGKSGHDSSRPDLVGEYSTLLERRFPWYEKTADFILDMKEIEVVDAIKILIDRFGVVD